MTCEHYCILEHLWWKLDDGGGTILTSEVGPSGTTSSPWAEGRKGSCLGNEGGTYSSITHSAIAWKTDKITLIFWICPQIELTGTQIFASLGGADWQTLDKTFQVYSIGNTLKLSLNSRVGETSRATTYNYAAPGYGCWFHIAAFLDYNSQDGRGRCKLWFEGVPQQPKSSTLFKNPQSNGTFASATLEIANTKNCYVDDVRIYDGNLNDAEICAIMKQ